MLGRLVIILVAVLGVGLYLPDSRALLADWVSPLLEPGRRWMTNQELERISEDFGIYLGGRDLSPMRRGEFDTWLDRRYPQTRSRVDGWGTRYTARVARTGFDIVSAGPDGVFDTDDDLVVSGVRR